MRPPCLRPPLPRIYHALSIPLCSINVLTFHVLFRSAPSCMPVGGWGVSCGGRAGVVASPVAVLALSIASVAAQNTRGAWLTASSATSEPSCPLDEYRGRISTLDAACCGGEDGEHDRL